MSSLKIGQGGHGEEIRLMSTGKEVWKKAQHKFRAQTEDKARSAFTEWYRKNVGRIRDVGEPRIERVPIAMQQPSRGKPLEAEDAVLLTVECEERQSH
jgi:hypothetical protein